MQRYAFGDVVVWRDHELWLRRGARGLVRSVREWKGRQRLCVETLYGTFYAFDDAVEPGERRDPSEPWYSFWSHYPKPRPSSASA